jgi:peptide/nickel transport system substrate-binding protein
MEPHERTPIGGRWHTGERALSTMTAAIVMAVVVIVIGAGAYVALSAAHAGNNTVVTCSPPGSAGCARYSASLHDLTVLSPLKASQTNYAIPFTVNVPAGDGPASQFKIDFGDGNVSPASNSPTASHAYQFPGTYLIQAYATVGGAVHDNLRAIAQVTVTASYAVLTAGNAPSVAGLITANTSSPTAPSAILHQGNSVTVQGLYSGLPTNPNFVPQPPTLSVSGSVTPTVTAHSNTSVTASATFANAGTYVIAMKGVAVGAAGSADAGQSAVQQYLWTAIVAPTGTPAGLAGAAVPPDPHPGTIIYYNSAPGGARTLDPAVAYDSVSYEPILSVYEGLIMYNGSQTGTDPSSYLPVIASCVPGPNSASCEKLYGSTLYNPTTNNYTFPIVANAQFYNPHDGKNWSVYPSDVVFSIARTLAFADLPSAGSNNGWILAQSILPGTASTTMAANPSWDGGIHAPYNNTPQAIFSAMGVNTSECPSAAMTSGHGCVTFHVYGNDQNWPYFLELIADQQGSSVVPCGWFSSGTSTGGQAGIPWWTTGSSWASDAGDHPCTLPGGAKSTNDAAFTANVSAIPPTAWDAYEAQGSGANGGGSIGRVISDMVGSGPFYLSNYQIGTSYALTASPAYNPNPYCTWQNCMPIRGHTAQKVEETWETSVSQGEQALASGVADFATIPASDTSLALQLVQNGKINVLNFPSISTYFFPFTLDFNVQGAIHGQPNPVNVPGDWFSYVGMRQFFTTAYPYSTILSTVLTVDGLQGAFNYGGAIPQFMGNYYPTNISWPSQDPSQACSGSGANGVLCATYWWHQITTPSSPYYDPETAACTPSTPCQIPLFGETGAPPLDEQETLWVNSLNSLSGGALKVTYTDINFVNLVINSLFSGPGQNPMPVYTLGWAPDYPDPTDYVKPMYLPDSTYTYSDAVAEQLAHYNASGCSTDYRYWAAQSAIPQDCQGAAYNAMVGALNTAASLPGGPARVLMYNQAEHIANELALYTYQYQSNQAYNAAAWVNVTTINTNVTTGGGGDLVWWGIGGNGVWGTT